MSETAKLADELLAELHEQVNARDTSLFDVGSSPEHKAAGTIGDIEIGLIESGARRALARRLEGDAMLDVASWVRAADEAGIERTRIAHLTGISRRAVYDVIGAVTS